MVPARNLLRRHYDSYGGCFPNETTQQQKPSLMPLTMAEEDSRAHGTSEGAGEDEEEGGTSSKDGGGGGGGGGGSHDGWLRLGIGGGGNSSDAATKSTTSGGGGREVTELQLFSDKPSGHHRVGGGTPAMTLFPTAPAMPLGFWSVNSVPQLHARFDYRQFVRPQWGPGLAVAGEGTSGSGGGMRIVSPPRRPQAGVWLLLQAAQNQGREPFLPQIPKSYLRIKDGRMPVRLLIKYLVNKLGLVDESEVEIRCRGQQLFPFLTLQHVRDQIWCSGDVMVSLPLQDSSAVAAAAAAEHVMALQYGRSA